MITFEPPRILLSIGPFNIYTWGVMFVIAFLAALFFILREARKRDIDEKHVYMISLLVLLGALVGGRLFYIFEHLGYFISKPLEIFMIQNGGITSYGGFILAIFFSWLYIRKQQDIEFLHILDMFAPWIALALAIGRIGCFLNWDDYGIESSLPWAIQVNGDIPRHPTQFYLALVDLVIFAILMNLKKMREWQGKLAPLKKDKFGFADVLHDKQVIEKPGFIFFSFVLMYSVFRFLLDFFRAYEMHWLGLALSQWLLILLFLYSLCMMLYIWKPWLFRIFRKREW